MAGASRALTELSSVSQVWSTGYGRALLVKSGLLAATLAVAWLTRSSLAAGLDRATRLFPVELALLLGIVVAVGTLTDLAPGRIAASSPALTPSNVRPPPPPPSANAFVDARQAGRYAVTFAYRTGAAAVTIVGPDGQSASGVPVTVDGDTVASCAALLLDTASDPVGVSLRERRAPRVHRPEAPSPRRRRAPAPDPRRQGAALGRAARAARLGARPQPGHDLPRTRPGSARLPRRLLDTAERRGLAGDRDRRAPLGPATGRAVDCLGPVPPLDPDPVLGAEIAQRLLRRARRDHVLRPRLPGLVPAPVRPGTGRTLELHMVASSHFMVHTYSGFGRSPAISPPASR